MENKKPNKMVIFMESYFLVSLVAIPVVTLLVTIFTGGEYFVLIAALAITVLIYFIPLFVWAAISVVIFNNKIKTSMLSYLWYMLLGAAPGLAVSTLSPNEAQQDVWKASICYGPFLFLCMNYFLIKRGYNKSFRSTSNSGAAEL